MLKSNSRRIMVEEIGQVGRGQIMKKKFNFILLVVESLRNLSRKVTEDLFVGKKTVFGR